MEHSSSSWSLGLDWSLPSKQPEYQNILTGQRAKLRSQQGDWVVLRRSCGTSRTISKAEFEKEWRRVGPQDPGPQDPEA